MPTTLQNSWDSQIIFMKFVEAANNFKKLAEVRKNFEKFLKFVSNFTKFMGLTNNFYEGRRSCKQLCKVRETWQKLYEVCRLAGQI